jgi:hypothetical protein
MRASKIIVPVLLIAVTLNLITALNAAGQRTQDKPKQKPQVKPQERVTIPIEVKTAIQEGLASRQGRQDISVDPFHFLFLPAKENYHGIFFMKIKDGDLGFAPVSADAPAIEKKEVPVKKGPQEVAVPQEAENLQAKFHVFLQFNRIEEEAEPQAVKEVYIPTILQVPADGFDPEKTEIYTLGYPMPAGHYLLALAIASLDLQKIGVGYIEFSLPDAAQFTKTLETTPIFFIKELDQMEGPETHTALHKGYFTYSILKVVPNLEKVFSAGDNLDIFFYIFGAQPNAQQQFEIEINYEVKKEVEKEGVKEDQMAIRWSPQTYNNPLISQPLPLKQTVNIKSEAGERTESRDLPPGNYTLVITILDKTSGNTTTKTVDFEMK